MDRRLGKWDHVLLVAAAVIAGVVFWITPPDDPGLPKVVYDRDGKPWTQQGERIEEDMPQWTCTRDDNRCDDE